MTLSKNILHRHLPFILFLFAFIIVGLFIYKDYGISWDEPTSRLNCGDINYNFITNGDYKHLIEGNEKYHGPAFEIFLIYLEKQLNMLDTQAIYRMRHLVTFLLFALSVFFFYLVIYKFSRSTSISFLACVFLVLSPRIFADAFYNSKDLALLSFAIICLYTTINFINSRNLLSIFFHALSCAILIDIRILGIIFPIFTIVYSVLKFYFEGNWKKIFTRIIPYILLLIPLIILFWPVLWRNPFENFIAAYKEMKKYQWDGPVLFNGKNERSINLPWQYIPVWIGITTPILYQILFCTGLLYFLRKVYRSSNQNFKNIFNYDHEWLNLFVIIVPVFAVIILNSVVYDGWRHLYFIYPSIIFFGVIAIQFIWGKLSNHKFKFIFNLIIFISCASTIYSMIRLHPYQQIYFNYLTRNSLNSLKQRFEMDYWGLANYEGLKYIVANDNSKIIKLCADNYPGEGNALMLDETDRDRLKYISCDSANYFVTDYRYHPDDYPYKEIYSVIVGDAKIMTVYALHPETFKINKPEKIIFNHKNNFSEANPAWKGIELNNVKSNDEERYSIVRDNQYYASGVLFTIDSTLSNPGIIKSKIEFKINSRQKFNYTLISEVDDSAGKLYSWNHKDLKYTSPSAWEKVSFCFDLPNFKYNDQLKFYFLNTDSVEFNVDDFEINIFKVE